MEMVDALPGLIPDVGDHPVALQSQLFGKPGDDGKDMPHSGLIGPVHLGHRLDMLLGDDQEVGGGLGVDVVEGAAEVVLIDLFRRDLRRRRSYRTDNRS